MLNIDSILKEKKLTKTAVALKMGMTRENFYRILQGNPTLESVRKLSDALGVSISDLFPDAPPAPPAAGCVCPKCGTALKIDLQVKDI